MIQHLRRRSLRPLALLVVVPALTLACSDTSTEPDATLSFTGTVAFESASFHDFTSARVEILRIKPSSFVQTLADGTVNDPSPLLPGIRLGAPTSDGCIPTSAATFLAPGQTTSYRVDPGSYCFEVFDSGFFPEGSTIDYNILVEIERY